MPTQSRPARLALPHNGDTSHNDIPYEHHHRMHADSGRAKLGPPIYMHGHFLRHSKRHHLDITSPKGIANRARGLVAVVKVSQKKTHRVR